MNKALAESVAESVVFLRKQTDIIPEVLIIAGSGFGSALDHIEKELSLPYEKVPHFKPTAIETHSGEVILGSLAGKPVMALSGRFHAYEGYSFAEITHGVRVAAHLGARYLIVTNLSGGINPCYELGDFVLINDHINLSGSNPLAGNYYNTNQERFVDLLDAYSPRLLELARKIARLMGIPLREGVLAYLTGPSFETKAELRFLEKTGSDLIGWSMVPEVIVARAEGMECLGLCCVSDLVNPARVKKADLGEIFSVGTERATVFGKFLSALIKELS